MIKMNLQMIKFEEDKKAMDAETFSKLYADNYTYLYGFAFKRINDVEDAKDVLQETFTNVYFCKKHSVNEKNFLAYMKASIKNQCKKYYEEKSNHREFFDVNAIPEDIPTYMEDPIDYNILKNALNNKELEVFDLYYNHNLTEKQIAEKLNINLNTVKSMFKRGKEKIRDKYKKFFMFVLILCIFISATVIAVSFINYIQDMFRTYKNGMTNDGVLEAIETKGWFQKTDMDYIDLGDGYKIKLDYFLLDEMSLYLVFDLTSEKDLSKYNEFSILDLKIENENGELIYNFRNSNVNQCLKVKGSKNILVEKHHLKQLVYMYADSFPTSNSLNISFSRLGLHKNLLFDKNVDLVNSSFYTSVNISEKFRNRSYINYTSDNPSLRKALIAETGFYAIVNLDYVEEINVILVDEKGNEYNCFTSRLNNYDDSKTSDHIIVTKFNDRNAKNLKLIIDNVEYELKNQP